MNWTHTMEQLVGVALFGAVGIAVFLAAFWLAVRITPFSVRKEIEEDHNVAFAVLLGSVIVGLSIIVAAAISG